MKLTRFALLVATFVFSVSALSAQEIGLQLSSFNEQLASDPKGTMARVREMGITQVEMNGTHGMSFPEFIKLLAVNGISVISYETDFEKLKAFPQVVADEARSYGAKFVVCSIPGQNEVLSRQALEEAALSLNSAGKVISRNGLLLCYQPSGMEFGSHDSEANFDFLVAKLDSRFVHFEMDVFKVKQAGLDPVALLKKYPSRFVLLQLKDRKPGSIGKGSPKSEKELNVALGTGDVGIRNVVETAKDLGIQYYFIEDESSRAEKQVPKSLAYLKALNSKDTAKK